MRKKTKQLMALAMAAVMGLTACSGGSEGSAGGTTAATSKETAAKAAEGEAKEGALGGGEQITLSLWMSFAPAERQESVEKVVAEYEAEHPNVKVDITYLPDGGLEKARPAYAAGEGPDVYRVGIDPEFIKAGYVIPLNQYVDSWEGRENMLESAINYAKSYDTTGAGNLYYMPIGATVTTFWVRSDWMKEAGVDIDTWEHFFEAVPAMTDKSQEKYGLAIRGGSGGMLFLEAMMYSYSGLTSLFDENGKTTINDPRHVEFVDKYLGFYNKCTAEGDIGYDYIALSAAFDAQKAGIIIHNLGSANDHLNAFDGDMTKFEAKGMPLNEGGTSVNPMKADDGFMISSSCKHPDEAFELIAKFSQGEGLSEHCRQWGNIPMNKEVLEQAEWLKEYPWFKAAADLLLSDTTVFYDGYVWLPNRKNILNEMQTYSQEVMVGQMSAQEFLDIWAEKVQQDYDENVKK